MENIKPEFKRLTDLGSVMDRKNHKSLAKEKINEIMSDMLNIAATHASNPSIIKSLATHLDLLLIQKKHSEDGVNKSLLEYVYGDVQVPKILSVKNHIRNNWRTAWSPTSKEKVPISIKEFHKMILRAHSFIVYNTDSVKFLTKNHLEKTPLKLFLKTPVLVIRNKSKKQLWFSVSDVIKLIRNKETAHFDVIATSDKDDKFSALMQIRDRHTIIRAIFEYILGVYDGLIGKNVHWNVVKQSCGHLSFHYNHPSMQRSSESPNISGPLILGRINPNKVFLQVHNCSGLNFVICDIDKNTRLIKNHKDQVILQYDDREDVLIPE